MSDQAALPIETFEHQHVCLGHRPPRLWTCGAMVCRPGLASAPASPKTCIACLRRT
jgi:hypothetical protein